MKNIDKYTLCIEKNNFLPGAIRASVIFLAISCLMSCGEVEKNLGDGYFLIETNAITISIYKNQGYDKEGDFSGPNYVYVVGAFVSRYSVIESESLIIGEVIATDPASEFKKQECPGWFVIDREMGTVNCGMREIHFKQYLSAAGIKYESIVWTKIK